MKDLNVSCALLYTSDDSNYSTRHSVKDVLVSLVVVIHTFNPSGLEAEVVKPLLVQASLVYTVKSGKLGIHTEKV